ncbi:MAG TPA: hypothetical protein VLC48_07690 [Gemmatimonadota bacterium]|nr:hypothetical protein [Gemmatimonadota bacterium]
MSWLARRLFVMTLAVASPGPTAFAQETETPAPAGFGLGLVAVYQQFSEELEGLEGGFGGALSARYTWYSGLQLLGGVQYSIHDISGFPGNVGFLQFFVDPRYVIELFDSQRIVLLVAGRLAYVRQISDGATEASGGGLVAGGSVGGLYGVNRSLAVEVTFLFGGIWTERLQAEAGSAGTVTGSLTSIQAGLVWSLGGPENSP